MRQNEAVTASVPVSAFGANKLRQMLEIADDITNAELSRKHISSTKQSLDDVTYTGGKLMEIAATYGLGTIQDLLTGVVSSFPSFIC